VSAKWLPDAAVGVNSAALTEPSGLVAESLVTVTAVFE